MKTYSVLFLLFGFCLIGSGQERIQVVIEDKKMSQGMQTAFTVLIPEAEVSLTEKVWEKYANDRPVIKTLTKHAGRLIENTYKTIANAVSPDTELKKKRNRLKMKREHNELIIENIVHEHLTQEILNIYARVVPFQGGTRISTFFQYADSIFLSEENTDEDTWLSIKNYIFEFGIEAYSEVVHNQINEADRQLRRSNVVLRNMVSRNERYHQSIARAEAEIDKCESTVFLNRKQIDRVNENLNEIKKQSLRYKKESIQYENMNDLLKERKKEIRKLNRQNKRLKTKIKKLNSRIKRDLSAIVSNELEQEEQKAIILDRESDLKQLEEKWQNIQNQTMN
jgi:hypothetical protein